MQVTIPALLQSKKFIAAALATVVSYLAIRDGMTREQIAFVVGPLLVFIGAQGVADIGKESAKVETLARKAPSINIKNTP